jgi:hypothetical protein
MWLLTRMVLLSYRMQLQPSVLVRRNISRLLISRRNVISLLAE